MGIETMEDMLKYVTTFAKDFLSKVKIEKDELSIPATMFVLKGDNIYVTYFEEKEEFIKAIKSVSALKPKIVAVLIEGYVTAYKEDTGEFLGNREIINIQVYSKYDKISRIIDKFNFDKYVDTEDFDGSLSIKDYDRVFNFEE